ncbi:hypothetical protein [Turicibacter sp.]|uniref:hypothetical protein n=1 Tax=Turicibacter sp. TaxID=2049042 RepID=UPI001B66148E|nr:hypothetical protein [Turicibacter sp.]MBP3904474.1 hypothetical protein [Turicibacter sp.]MBP3908032.1 hypothetical protein [Turicibacter sp.]
MLKIQLFVSKLVKIAKTLFSNEVEIEQVVASVEEEIIEATPVSTVSVPVLTSFKTEEDKEFKAYQNELTFFDKLNSMSVKERKFYAVQLEEEYAGLFN